jgi:hypothetical protein
MKDRVLQLRRPKAASRGRLESFPAHGRSDPFLRSFLPDSGTSRGYCIGLLVEVFSPERFQPAYWKQFGLPDLASELRDLDLDNRVTPLRAILTEEEFEQFCDAMYGVVSEWTAWRERFSTTKSPEDGRPANGQIGWSDETLQSKWDEIMQAMDDLRQHLHRVAVVVARRIPKPVDGKGMTDTRHTG